MLTYNLEKRGDAPLYEYLYKCIKNDIIDGQLKAGDKLPSKRMLADNLSVSLITVQNAYEQLLLEGYIFSLEKKGYYVAEIDTLPSIGSKNDSNKSSKSELSIGSKAYVDARKSKHVEEDEKQADYKADFTASHGYEKLFPFPTWARLMRKTLLNEKPEAFLAKTSTGSKRLRETLARYLYEFRGLNVSADNIVIGAGMEYLYGLLVQLLGRDKMIAVEDPGHSKVYKIYESNGVKTLHVPIDNDGLIPDKIDIKKVSAIHITPSHHFPMGVTMPASRRHSIVRLAIDNDKYIIEDDFDSEFRYELRPLPTLASLAMDNVIYMNTFSKSMMGVVRIAYMVLPDRLMDIYKEKLGFYSSTVPAMEQFTLASFIEEGFYERHINRVRLYFKRRKQDFKEAFADSKLSEYGAMAENTGGGHCIIKLDDSIDEGLLRDKLEKKGIRIHFVSQYCYKSGSKYSNTLVINYSDIEKEKLIKVFNDITDMI